MKFTVQKIKVEPRTIIEIALPLAARILKLSVLEDGNPYLLVFVNQEESSVSQRQIRFYETDEPIHEKELDYLGSVLTSDATGRATQLHCFEVMRFLL